MAEGGKVNYRHRESDKKEYDEQLGTNNFENLKKKDTFQESI